MIADEFVQRWKDQQAITDRLHEYCRELDRANFIGVGSVFTEDCVVDYSDEVDAVTVGREALLAQLPLRLGRFRSSSHRISNIQVAFAPRREQANVVSYLHATCLFTDSTIGELWGQYHDVFVRSKGDWLIHERRLYVANQRNFARAWHPTERRSFS
jgi:hypothetical protein